MRTVLFAPCVLIAACASSSPPVKALSQDDAHAEALPGRVQCPAGRGDCDGDPGNGCETDLSADADNCRACGHACTGASAAAAMCVDGRCAQSATGR